MKNEMIYPAIVIATYNRPHALSRLLNSIAVANYDGYNDIPLVISIDGGGNPKCEEIANNFAWTYGKKMIITHVANLGLKQHILSCGDLTERFGAIIMLEEDLIVSPYFYDYTVQTSTYYQFESKIAGVSLHSYKAMDLTGVPITPMANGNDVFFAQIPSSWGQCWTKKQWQEFKKYFMQYEHREDMFEILPKSVRESWPSASSWKKYFYSYMVEKDMYFVIPYASYTTNMADLGEHFFQETLTFQVPLMMFKKSFVLSQFNKCMGVYDAYFELLPETIKAFGQLFDYDFEVDLAGAKSLCQIKKPYLLSIKETSKPIFSYDMSLTPVEMNVIYDVRGKYIHFAKTKDFIDKRNEVSYFRIMRLHNEICYNISKLLGYKTGYETGISLMRNKRAYRIGHVILSPFRILKRLYNNFAK